VTCKIEILRDRAGVPHVYGTTTADVYFGLGYAMAEDRLWQMDRLRRRAYGRQAEILGPAYVDSDLLHRAVGITSIAAAEVEANDDATRDILESFVAGINRYIDQCGAKLAIEFTTLGYAPEPFSVRDSIAILRAEWWSLNGRLHNIAIGEAARLLPADLQPAFLTPDASETRILPPDAPYPTHSDLIPAAPHDAFFGTGDNSGSNNWAVAAEHTAHGHAILCSDPHQPFWVPSSWYEYAIHGPDDSVAGAGHPGVPGLWWGSNGSIAWGITNNAASTRDLYREELHPNDPHLYRDGDTWRPFVEHEVVIHVRGEAPVRHLQRATVRGPIVNHVLPTLDEAESAPIALRWVGHEHLDDIRAAIAIGRAHAWPEFRAALRDWAVAVFNFGYADSSGHVGYQCAGRVPVRGRVARGYRDANAPEDAWQGYVPFEGLPSSFAPRRGYIASANERVAPDDYPYPLHGSWGTGYRAERIHQALDDNFGVDAAFAVALQNDVKSRRAERLCSALVEHLADQSDPDLVRLCQVLASWDYCYTLDSVAPTLFETFMDVWQERVMLEHFPQPLLTLLHAQTGVAARLIEYSDLEWFSGSVRAELRATAAHAMEQVRARFGQDPAGWQWGTIHRAHWRHPLSGSNHSEFDIGPEPVDGGNDTLRNTGVGWPDFSAVGGAEYRIVVDFAEPHQFLAVQNIGNSGQPGSPHYADQFADWLAGRYHVVSLRREKVERDLESSITLERARGRVSHGQRGQQDLTREHLS
jgi:penicillin G amidase